VAKVAILWFQSQLCHLKEKVAAFWTIRWQSSVRKPFHLSVGSSGLPIPLNHKVAVSAKRKHKVAVSAGTAPGDLGGVPSSDITRLGEGGRVDRRWRDKNSKRAKRD
jgi:hypothetical protein